LACHLQIDADPYPDPAYYFDADRDLDPAFQFDADPDPLGGSCVKLKGNLRSYARTLLFHSFIHSFCETGQKALF
jgi:hypothetical protein